VDEFSRLPAGRLRFLPKDGHRLKLRLEAFNSVDGSSRLSVLLSWFRLVCSNGLTIKESVREVRDLHNSRSIWVGSKQRSSTECSRQGVISGESRLGKHEWSAKML